MSKNISSNERFVKFIAYMQVIGIILVVFGHSFHEYPDGNHGTSMLIYRMMFSFRMPTFMFVSGFLMAFTTFLRNDVSNLSYKKFVKNKIKRLLIPYAVLTLVTFFPRAIMSPMADDAIEMSWAGLVRGFLYIGYMPVPLFWFIQASFLLLVFSFSIMYVTVRCGVNKYVGVCSLIVLFTMLPFFEISNVALFSIGYAVKYGLFFSCGIIYAISFKKIDTVVPFHRLTFLMVSGALWGILFFLTEQTVLYPLCQLAGIVMVISIAHIMEYRDIKVIDHLIGSNYMIFLLSWYFNVLTQQVLAHVIVLPWYIHTVLSIVFGIYIPYLFYRYLCAHQHLRGIRYVACLLGQNIGR